VITKGDLCEYRTVHDIYQKAGFPVFFTGADDGEQLKALHELMKNKLCAFAGNSGVGKSTLLNKLFPNLDLQTNAISRKLGRGKHTTRQVEIFEIEGCMVADTPGFSSIELDYDNFISKDDLQHAFTEFEKYMGKCKFNDCSHTGENGCAIKKAVEEGAIPTTRYESYLALYDRQKSIKDWEQK
ncbi:MAG: ribosome small subunit-dependent GTPase A, partial [Oscillospiraceae bacterium]